MKQSEESEFPSLPNLFIVALIIVLVCFMGAIMGVYVNPNNTENYEEINKLERKINNGNKSNCSTST